MQGKARANVSVLTWEQVQQQQPADEEQRRAVPPRERCFPQPAAFISAKQLERMSSMGTHLALGFLSKEQLFFSLPPVRLGELLVRLQCTGRMRLGTRERVQRLPAPASPVADAPAEQVQRSRCRAQAAQPSRRQLEAAAWPASPARPASAPAAVAASQCAGQPPAGAQAPPSSPGARRECAAAKVRGTRP